MSFKKFTLVALLVFTSTFAFSQFRFEVRLGDAIPMGDFGSGTISKTADYPYGDLTHWSLNNVNGKDGYAGMGVNLGFDATYMLPVKGLGVMLGIDLFFNGLNSDMYTCLNDYTTWLEHEIGIREADITKPYYFNIPIMIGANYTYSFNDTYGIWGEVALGPNFRLVSNSELKIDYEIPVIDDEGNRFIERIQTQEFKSATTFAFKIGAGALFWNRMSVGIEFVSLGSKAVEWTYIDKHGGIEYSRHDYTGNKAMSASEFLIRIGYRFPNRNK